MSSRVGISSGATGAGAITAYTYPYAGKQDEVINVGDVVYLCGSMTIAKASTSIPVSMPPFGIVTGMLDSKYSVAVQGQVADGLVGLNANTTYWLDATPGAYTAIKPGSNAYRVGLALSTTQMLILSEISGAQGATGPASTVTGPTGPSGYLVTGPAGNTGLAVTGPTGIVGPTTSIKLYYLSGEFQGPPAASEPVARIVLSSNSTVIGGSAYCDLAPSAQTILTVQKGAYSGGVLSYTNIGTITYEAADLLGTVAITGNPVSFSSGELVRVINQASPDPTFSGPYFTLYGNQP